MPPDDFIPLAEKTGFIGQIDRWAMAEACRQLAQRDAARLGLPRVAVNLSARELHDAKLVSWLRAQLEANGLRADRFEGEFTAPCLWSFLTGRCLCCSSSPIGAWTWAMDDFSSGYSNPAHLVRTAPAPAEDRSLSDLGHRLGLPITHIWAGQTRNRSLLCPVCRHRARLFWIGWNEPTRKRHLPRVINNSRFLILPNVRVPHLASHVLGLALRRVALDWEACYGLR
ncbi:EAL domain-containing protein, partial [Aquisalimonas sp.]|uniref:EAL domain-containing protein n=1 Tax=Aquisalimonas sp. TaxID=1872621 RepID=UPI0025C4D5FA